MKRLLYILGLVGALSFLPSPALADDGDACKDSSGNKLSLGSKGAWVTTNCIQVCDGKAATEECADYDFYGAPGMPDLLVLEYEMIAGCTSTPDITITTASISGVEYGPSSSALVLNSVTNRILIKTADGSLSRYIAFSTADDANCTDIDVRMFFKSRKNRL